MWKCSASFCRGGRSRRTVLEGQVLTVQCTRPPLPVQMHPIVNIKKEGKPRDWQEHIIRYHGTVRLSPRVAWHKFIATQGDEISLMHRSKAS